MMLVRSRLLAFRENTVKTAGLECGAEERRQPGNLISSIVVLNLKAVTGRILFFGLLSNG